jgi:hypothetical protein
VSEFERFICSVTLKNFANAERAEGESWSSMKAPRSGTSGKRASETGKNRG